MARRALLVGINEYDNFADLGACVDDAVEMASVLSRNGDNSLNYDCKLITSPGYHEPVTRGVLREQCEELFATPGEDVLFYFSGHGAPTAVGGQLATQDGARRDPGLAMNDLLTLANQSRARSVLMILDCCFSGDLGNPANLQGGSLDQAQLAEGVTILSASRPTEVAMEVGGHGVFTKLLLGALRGGAMDIRGRVSAASLYAYAEAALGSWDQRPQYKSHASRLDPVRTCIPRVSDDLLRDIATYFPNEDHVFELNPSFEHTHADAVSENVAIFDKLKILRDGGLIKTQQGDDLYYCALASNGVILTELGQFYLHLVETNRI